MICTSAPVRIVPCGASPSRRGRGAADHRQHVGAMGNLPGNVGPPRGGVRTRVRCDAEERDELPDQRRKQRNGLWRHRVRPVARPCVQRGGDRMRRVAGAPTRQSVGTAPSWAFVVRRFGRPRPPRQTDCRGRSITAWQRRDRSQNCSHQPLAVETASHAPCVRVCPVEFSCCTSVAMKARAVGAPDQKTVHRRGVVVRGDHRHAPTPRVDRVAHGEHGRWSS